MHRRATFVFRSSLLLAVVLNGCGSPSATTDGGSNNNGQPLAHTNQQPVPNCTLIVPDNPLSAQGLATPYQLEPPCSEANSAAQGAFVQAVILDPATGNLSVYNPLVVTDQDRPLIAPSVPTLPQNAVVGIWFGFNGTTLTLKGQNRATLQDANCINGLNDSQFGQVAACNAVNFFGMANAAIGNNLITPPALGTAADGNECPTTRDFSVVDQDPSDNVTTSYLVDDNGRVAQNTPENVANLKSRNRNFTVITNGSDNALLSQHLDPALSCTPWTAPDITSASNPNTPAQALDELHAGVFHSIGVVPQSQVALVESADEMVLVNGQKSAEKLNLYRSIVNQPADVDSSTQNYCQQLRNIGAPRLAGEQKFLQRAATIDAAMGNNLFTFMVARLQTTMGNQGNGLNCGQFGINFPFKVRNDGNGVVISATFDP